MAQKSTQQLLCVLLLIVFPLASIQAEVAPALVYMQGNATLNGKTVSANSSAVNVGDVVATATGASAKIIRPGMKVTLLANSALVYRGTILELRSGTAVVGANSGTTTQIRELRVTPAAASANFQVTAANGNYEITALHGALTVTDGSSTQLLAAGKTMSTVDDQSATASTAPSGKTGIAKWKIGVLTAGAAGALLGGLASGSSASTQQAVSPHRP